MKFPPAARVCCPVLSPCTCDSGAVAAGTGTVGSSRHLAGATLLPGAVPVGRGRGRGWVGWCGETEGGITAVQQQALLLYKIFTFTIHYFIPTKFCTAVIKNSTVINFLL